MKNKTKKQNLYKAIKITLIILVIILIVLSFLVGKNVMNNVSNTPIYSTIESMPDVETLINQMYGKFIKMEDSKDEKYYKDIYVKFQEVLAYRENFKCVGCATCCKLACSEFSPEELRQKAENGDNFAKQFLSVFIPYNSKEEAKAVYPDYIELLEENKEDNVYFYHCPKLTKDNRCSDYENRPDICRRFPDNPLSLLPSKCGYRRWKEEVEPLTLMLHSMIEIIDYYKEKIKC